MLLNSLIVVCLTLRYWQLSELIVLSVHTVAANV